MSANEPVIQSETSPGTQLRKAREGAGLTLAQIAQKTLIPVSRLQSLERDDYTQVGATAFVVGYTRTYARTVGLDPVPLLQLLETRLPPEFPTRHQPPSVALSLEVRKRPGSAFWPLMWIFIVLLVVVMGIGNLGDLNAPTPAPDLIPPSTPAPLADVQTQVRPEIALPTEEPPAHVLEAALDPQTAPVLEVEQELSPESEDGDADVIEAAAGSADTLVTADAPRSELTLSFSGDCWVEVVDASGKRIVAQLASSGDNLRLFGPAPFNVTLGDARMVELNLNGRPVDITPPAGRKMARVTVAEQ
jgi:cytoskeleton protein RodZ